MDGENLPPESDLKEGPRSARPRPRTVLLGVGVAGIAAAFAKFRPSVAQVEGPSMRPTLEPGAVVLVLRLRPRVGSLVEVTHPNGRLDMVKRLTSGPGDTVTFGPASLVLGPDEWWIEGDAEEWSTDSRRFGPVPGSAIRGRCFVLRRQR